MNERTGHSGNSNVVKKPALLDQTPVMSGVVKRPVIEAQAEAERIVAEAEVYAASVRGAMQTLERETREAAYREGHEAILLELNQLLLETRERRDAALVEAEHDLLRLSIKLAEKIIGREIKLDNTTVVEIVSTALRTARQNELLIVRVHPSDLPVIQAQRERLDPAGRARFLDIVADPRVHRGGCIIESESGTVDAQLETQLRVLERALFARASSNNR
ncbi:MAG: hypothetical protein H0T92_24725 [Pyrinomonadaceae bacterium]|nr:hypothetical protein [Pyrinomonadaceae bacterium]